MNLKIREEVEVETHIGAQISSYDEWEGYSTVLQKGWPIGW